MPETRSEGGGTRQQAPRPQPKPSAARPAPAPSYAAPAPAAAPAKDYSPALAQINAEVERKAAEARAALVSTLFGASNPTVGDSLSRPDKSGPEVPWSLVEQRNLMREPGEPVYIPEAKAERQAFDIDAALRGERARAIGADPQGDKHGKVVPMTAAQYEALSPRQKAAIDFNTRLVGAVRRDRKLQDEYKPNDEQRANYDALVTEMFGEDGGSEVYAPETMAVLNQIDFRDDTADLDDFLGLKAAITAKDLKYVPKRFDNITSGAPAALGGVTALEVNRIKLAQDLAASTADMQKAVAQGQQFLDTIGRTMKAERLDDINLLGGLGKLAKAPLGYGAENWITDASGNRVPGDLNTFFRQGFDTLARKENDGKREEILGFIGSKLSDEQYQEFMRYVDQRSGNSARYGLPLGDGKDVDYKKPEVFRHLELLGLEGAPDARR